MGNLSIKIVESTSSITKKINQGIANIFNKTLSKQRDAILRQVKPIIHSALIDSPEIRSLSFGELRIDFGLTSDPSQQIANAIVNSLDVKSQRASATSIGVKGGLLITMQPIDYNNLFSLPLAEQITEKGESLPWLQWLLTFGQQVIIADFGVEYGPRGRSGGGIMISHRRPFKVRSGYAGTPDDNFITRAVERVSPEIKGIIRKAMQ